MYKIRNRIIYLTCAHDGTQRPAASLSSRNVYDSYIIYATLTTVHMQLNALDMSLAIGRIGMCVHARVLRHSSHCHMWQSATLHADDKKTAEYSSRRQSDFSASWRNHATANAREISRLETRPSCFILTLTSNQMSTGKCTSSCRRQIWRKQTEHGIVSREIASVWAIIPLSSLWSYYCCQRDTDMF